jgi:hypothetical protein
MMNVEEFVEWELARETETQGENISECHIIHHKSNIT